jgi:glycosyltransferase involved in cell wall biosynthesis
MPRSSRPFESRRIAFIVPGSIEDRTGGYEYDRRLIDELRPRGWSVDVLEITKGDPLPALPDGRIVVLDGLALDSIRNAEEAGARLKLVVIVHMAGASGTDERAALKAASAVVVTGAGAKLALVSSGIDDGRVTIVEPGTIPVRDLRERAGSDGSGSIVRLLSVGNVTEGKGHDRLVSALRSIRERNWRLTIVGSLTREPAAAARLERLIRESALDDRIELTGERPATDAAFASADAFVLATLHETYGMAVAEAIAWGLPVVSTSTGEIPKIVGDGGIIISPGDDDALASALSRLVGEPALRARLQEGARRARGYLRTWAQAGDELSAVLERVADE